MTQHDPELLDDFGRARRRLLKLTAYVAPAVITTLSLSPALAQKTGPSCAPVACGPNSCGPTNCPPTCTPNQGCSPTTCQPTTCRPTGN